MKNRRSTVTSHRRGKRSPQAMIWCAKCGDSMVVSTWIASLASLFLAAIRAPMTCGKCGAENSLHAKPLES